MSPGLAMWGAIGLVSTIVTWVSLWYSRRGARQWDRTMRRHNRRTR